jgi:hypothetical protein
VCGGDANDSLLYNHNSRFEMSMAMGGNVDLKTLACLLTVLLYARLSGDCAKGIRLSVIERHTSQCVHSVSLSF